MKKIDFFFFYISGGLLSLRCGDDVGGGGGDGGGCGGGGNHRGKPLADNLVGWRPVQPRPTRRKGTTIRLNGSALPTNIASHRRTV